MKIHEGLLFLVKVAISRVLQLFPVVPNLQMQRHSLLKFIQVPFDQQGFDIHAVSLFNIG